MGQLGPRQGSHGALFAYPQNFEYIRAAFMNRALDERLQELPGWRIPYPRLDRSHAVLPGHSPRLFRLQEKITKEIHHEINDR